jgi:hypothetical protein
MEYLACAFAAVLVLYASGLGFTLFLLPANLRIYSLIVAPWAGFSYMTLGCWYVYALGGNLTILFVALILIPPLLCLTGAVAVQDIRRGLPGIVFNRNVVGALLVAAAVFVLWSVPLLTHDRGLTSISLYNHDVANYATDSRFLIELVASSPGGFVEQNAEAFRVCPVQCYLGPVSFSAFLSVVCHLMPHHTTTLCINLFAALAVASLFLVLCDTFKTRTFLALLGLSLFGFHPLFTYIVWQGYFAQTVAMGLALMIFWVQGRLLEGGSLRGTVSSLVLLACFTLALLLSYQHMFPFVWAFAGIYATVIAIHRRSGQPIWRAVGAHLAAFTAAAVLCPTRALSFLSFLNSMTARQAGYFLPFFSPDYVAGLSYQNAPFEVENPIFHQIVMLTVIVAAFVSLVAAFKHSDKESRALWIACLIVYGGALILGLGDRYFAAGKYKSFKLVGFFLPFFIAGCVCLLRAAAGQRNRFIGTIVILALVVLSTGYLRADVRLLKAMRIAKAVEHDYQDLLAVDRDPKVDSVNLAGHNGWENMWAGYFLMHKKLYFEGPNYWQPQSVGGAYDLVDDQANLAVRHLPSGHLPLVRRLNGRFYLIGPIPQE